MLRISELAKKAKVSVPTIKHYLNEGLLPKPVKTGKTMAYYDESYIDRIKLIKKLQREKFLPLDVIRRMIDSEGPLDDELELGKAIYKSDKLLTHRTPVPESRVEQVTGFALDKIRVLEKEGVVFPQNTDAGKTYDDADIKTIEIMKLREELGVPFDHSVMLIRVYRDAMNRAVHEDLKLFSTSLLGDISTRQTVKLMTEADESLEKFILLYRQRLMRNEGVRAIQNLNRISVVLAELNFLPVACGELPSGEIDSKEREVVVAFLEGDYAGVLDVVNDFTKAEMPPDIQAAGIIAMLLTGDVDRAIEDVKNFIPEPASRPILNAAAALAYMYSVGNATGFSAPIYLVKRAMAYMARIEAGADRPNLENLFARYICGACYVMLPAFFDTLERGTALLENVSTELREGAAGDMEGPAWLRRTVEYELVPAMEARVNRFLAEALISMGEPGKALDAVDRIIEITEPDSEPAKWARIKKMELL